MYFPFLFVGKFMHRWEGLWGCEHADIPCGSECFVQVVLGQLGYPCPVPPIHFSLAVSLVNIYSIKLSSFYFISSYKCIIYLTPLLCYLKQEQSPGNCKLWGAISLFALVLQHPMMLLLLLFSWWGKPEDLHSTMCIV